MISAKVVGDSLNEFGDRLTTMVVTMPRIILAEFNTHRMFSRNSASSRAIPFEKMVKSVEENPFIPIAWQKDHKGMQGTEYFNEGDAQVHVNDWHIAKTSAINMARILHRNDVTKQLVNRLLEPFMWHTVIVTATEWENFFALRCPDYQMQYVSNNLYKEGDHIDHYRSKKDFIKSEELDKYAAESIDWFTQNKGQAEIHMMALAEAMWDARNESTPKQLKAGEWHIPFESEIDNREIEKLILGPDSLTWQSEQFTRLKVKASTVMAARTSYTVVGADQKPMTYARMIELHDQMRDSKPFHASPFEHCAEAMGKMKIEGKGFVENMLLQEVSVQKQWSGNFKGFKQYRKTFENENIVC
jgi:hypothetical protein